MVLEFKSSKNKIIENKRARFVELNTKYFMDNMSDDDFVEWNELEQWLKLHN